MMPDPLRAGLAFCLAFVAGLAATWVALGVAVLMVFRGPDTELPLAALVVPLVGIAVVQAVFVAMTGRWRGGRFWLWAMAATYGLGTLAVWAETAGLVGSSQAIAGFFGILGGLGLWRATMPTGPAGASRAGGGPQ
jgi:hypothetical protein